MSTVQRTNPLLKTPPIRMHHHAYTTDDHEATRHFYEDIIGLPLVAMWVEKEHLGGEWVELGHAFYRLGDGSALAFFNFADPKKQEDYRAKRQPLFVHLSLAVEQQTQDELQARLKAAGLEAFTMDHGYCHSLYVRDPNELLVEFTVDPPNVREIEATQRATAHEEMQRWISGGRESNNRWRSSGETDVSTA
ncbi:MAG TPA: VOC family protein [Steroidobacteraceae bacterium]|nr:VOC family protein [Steroidobacteraceae bacterium]